MPNSKIKLFARQSMLGNGAASAFLLAVCALAFSALTASGFAADFLSKNLPLRSATDVAVFKICLAFLTLCLSFILTGALSLCVQTFFLACAGGRSAPLFSWVSPRRALRAGTAKAVLFILKAVWSVPCFLPCAVCGTLVYLRLQNGVMNYGVAVTLFILTALLGIVGFVFWSIAVQRYFFVTFELAAHPEKSVFEAVGTSVDRAAPQLTRLFLFKLSFLPWWLLCVAIFPVFFVWQYYKQSLTCRCMSAR